MVTLTCLNHWCSARLFKSVVSKQTFTILNNKIFILRSLLRNIQIRHKINRLSVNDYMCSTLYRYVPALRQLRQIAMILSFPQTESTKLAGRLYEVRNIICNINKKYGLIV
jgi:hypothetical protein